MKKILKITASMLALLFVGAGIVYFFFPQQIVALINTQNAKAANLTAKSINLNGYKTNYYTNNNTTAKDTLVLLHGLGDDKNSFVQTAKFLTNDYYLILPDLLASGENSQSDKLDVSIKGQVTFLNNFLSELGIQKFNLAANSMGGHVSAAYAIVYPKQVKKLILVNAPGLQLDNHVVYTGFGAELKSEDDLQKVLARVFYQVPNLPSPIKKWYISQTNSSRDFLNNIIIPQIKNGAYFNLTSQIHQIKAPTLILWGKHDQVVKFNVAERYNRDIPYAELEVIENASHSPQLEVPKQVATSIQTFINKTIIMENKSPNTKDQHLAKAQFYRWYQLYEREITPARIDNQLDILTDDITLKSATGEMKGKENYPERLSVYKGWKNAHHVNNIQISNLEKGMQLEADIHYQNIRPDGEKKSYTLHYLTKLTKNGNHLPKFSYINIVPTGETHEAFNDAYPENRTKSLMHYWLANMEDLQGNVTAFKEILADDFVLNFSSSNPIKSISELETWLQTIPTQLQESSHTYSDYSVKTIMENEYEVNVTFNWKGVTKNGENVTAITKHIWYVLDNPMDRFSKILKVNVEALQPLTVVQ